MSVRPGALQSSAAAEAGKKAVSELLLIIDEKIRSSNIRLGRNVVEVSLPCSFGIPGLAAADQQLVVYSALAASLALRGFEPKLRLTAGGGVLYIGFTVAFSPEQLDEMRRLIGSVLVDEAAAKAFVAGGRG